MQNCNNEPTKWIKWREIYPNASIEDQCSDWDYLEFVYDEPLDKIRNFIYAFYADEDNILELENIDYPPDEWLYCQIQMFKAEAEQCMIKANRYEDWLLTKQFEGTSGDS